MGGHINKYRILFEKHVQSFSICRSDPWLIFMTRNEKRGQTNPVASSKTSTSCVLDRLIRSSRRNVNCPCQLLSRIFSMSITNLNSQEWVSTRGCAPPLSLYDVLFKFILSSLDTHATSTIIYHHPPNEWLQFQVVHIFLSARTCIYVSNF